MKRLLAILMTAIMILTMVPATAFADTDAAVEVGTAEALVAELEKATGGETFKLTKDIDLGNTMIKTDNLGFTLDGNGNTITSTAKKAFEINNTADKEITVTFKNVTIENSYTASAGRCINTRNDKINLTLDGVTLDNTGAAANTQPLTLGGTDTEGVDVVIKNSTINALDSGYAVLNFVKANITIEDSKLIGYTTLYCKAGADNTVINVNDSTLEGKNKHSGESNAFATIVVEAAKGVKMNIAGTEVLAESTGDQPQIVVVYQKDIEGVVDTLPEAEIVFCDGTTVKAVSASAAKILVQEEASDITADVTLGLGVTVSGVEVDAEYLADNTTIKNGKVVCAKHVYENSACSACGEAQKKEIADAAALAAAVADATGGETFKLTKDIDLGNTMIKTDNLGFTLDGNGNTITSTAKKAFEINNTADDAIDVTFKDVTIENAYTATGGRCINTRNDKIDLTLDGVTLDNTAGAANTQPLTLGGSEHEDINVVIKNSTIDAMDSGYPVLNFVKANITIEDSKLVGYTTLYNKLGSNGTVINVTGSTLEGINSHSGASNSFSTIVIEDAQDVTVKVKDSTVLAESKGDQPQFVVSYNNFDGTEAPAGKVEFTGNTTVNVVSAAAPKVLVNKDNKDAGVDVTFGLGVAVNGVKVSDAYLTDDTIFYKGKVICAEHTYEAGKCTVCGDIDYEYVLAEKEKENAALKEELESAKGELEDTKDELESTQEELEDTKGELESTKEDLKDTQTELESAKGDLKDTKDELESTKEDLKDTQTELKETQEELESAKQDLETTKEALKQTEESLEATKKELAEVKEVLANTNNVLESAQEELKNTKEELTNTQTEMAAMKTALLMTKTQVSGLKITASGTNVTASWKETENADVYNYILKKNGKVYKEGTTTKTSLKWTNVTRGCKYTVEIAPAVNYEGMEFGGITTSKSVNINLLKVTFAIKKNGSYQKVTAADQNSTGFQIYVSTSSKFTKNVKKINVKTSEGKLSKSLKTTKYFAKGKNYVKVRAYTTYNGTTTYGKWSSVKTVKR